MTDEPIYTPMQWAFSDQQREVAEYLAAGYSQRRTATLTGVGLRSINRWWTEAAGYQDFVMWMRAELMKGQRSMFNSSVMVAQSIYFKALTGDADPDDPTVELATRLLERTVWRHAKPAGGAGDGDQQQLPPGAA